MFEPWIVGDGARIPVAAADAAGQPIDPDHLRLKILKPDGTSTTYTYGDGPDLVRDALGQYHVDIHLTASGYWFWRWETDIPQAGVAEGTISVAASRFVQEAP